MPTLISGFGTAYVGKRDIGPDGSYVTTEWVMFFYLPVIPIRSFRVWPTGQSQRYVFYNSEGYAAQRVPLSKKQVLKVYLLWISLPIATIILAILTGYLLDYLTAT